LAYVGLDGGDFFVTFSSIPFQNFQPPPSNARPSKLTKAFSHCPYRFSLALEHFFAHPYKFLRWLPLKNDHSGVGNGAATQWAKAKGWRVGYWQNGKQQKQ
jgi:hypothetical protein